MFLSLFLATSAVLPAGRNVKDNIKKAIVEATCLVLALFE